MAIADCMATWPLDSRMPVYLSYLGKSRTTQNDDHMPQADRAQESIHSFHLCLPPLQRGAAHTSYTLGGLLAIASSNEQRMTEGGLLQMVALNGGRHHILVIDFITTRFIDSFSRILGLSLSHQWPQPDLLAFRSAYLGLHISGGLVGLPLLILTLLFCDEIPRQPDLINFCITWVIFSISYILV